MKLALDHLVTSFLFFYSINSFFFLLSPYPILPLQVFCRKGFRLQQRTCESYSLISLGLITSQGERSIVVGRTLNPEDLRHESLHYSFFLLTWNIYILLLFSFFLVIFIAEFVPSSLSSNSKKHLFLAIFSESKAIYLFKNSLFQ